jgi:hypothetical protein
MRHTSGISVVLLGVAWLAGCSSPRVDERPVDVLSSVDLYQRLCSSCHGVDARGDGPVATLIKTGVPDLTLLAHRDGGEFPTEDVRRAIDGRWDKHAHGARDMPVWGWQLYDMSSRNDQQERAAADSIIERLVTHLQSIQKP